MPPLYLSNAVAMEVEHIFVKIVEMFFYGVKLF